MVVLFECINMESAYQHIHFPFSVTDIDKLRRAESHFNFQSDGKLVC